MMIVNTELGRIWKDTNIASIFLQALTLRLGTISLQANIWNQELQHTKDDLTIWLEHSVKTTNSTRNTPWLHQEIKFILQSASFWHILILIYENIPKNKICEYNEKLIPMNEF